MEFRYMEELRKEGWSLTKDGYDLVTDKGSITDVQTIIKRAIDMDLREIADGDTYSHHDNFVLQIQKLRNVAAPKNNEESKAAPRMLKFSLTDGKDNFQAVEIVHIPGVSLNTPPGTKLVCKTRTMTTVHGIVLLGPYNIAKILGGKVPNLIEKWELNRKLATHSRLRSVEEGGPPPWIPFGKKIKGGLETEKNFKALGANKDSLDKETTEFEAQRQDAIAEAARLGGKKVFGGGNKQLLDHTVQKIVDQGFSVEQAEYALKISRNNVDRALKSLQRTNESRASGSRDVREPRESREQREPRTKRFDKKTEETKPSSGKVSLFDFLEDKLPAQGDTPETPGYQQQQHQHHQQSNDNYGNYRLENQFDRLELRGSEYPQQAGKGGRAQKGGRGYQATSRHVTEESKYPKRSSNNSYNQFPTNNSFGNTNQTKPPRFQRNQESRGVHQTENVFKSHYGRSSQPNERKNNVFGQSRSEIDTFTGDSGNYANKNNREEHRRSGKNNQPADRYQAQAVDSEPNKRHGASYDSSHGRHNRAQHEGVHRSQGTANATDKNYGNQSNKPHQSVTAERDERESNNCGNNRNSNNESTAGSWLWKVGDDCMAKYWEDNRYYNAQVTAVSATTCVVLFKDFNNFEEVLQVDCIPITEKSQPLPVPEVETRRNEQRVYGNRSSRYDQSDNHISGGMEFRRGGGGGGGSAGSKGYNRKRGQQRSAQPIYQPPPQRGHSSVTWSARDNPPL